MTTTPPTLVTTSATTWTGTTSPKTANVTVQTGDLIIVIGGTSNPARTIATPTGGGLTWTLVTSATGGSGVNSYCWQATATSNTTVTVSCTTSGTGSNWGFLAFVWRNHTGIGSSASQIYDGRAPSLDITTTGANSAIAWGNFDWNAVDGSSRVYRQVNSASPTEAEYSYQAGSYTVYVASHADAGAAGTKTVGLTAPGAQDQSMVAVEITGVTTAPSDAPTAMIVEIGLAANPGTASPVWTDVTADVLAGDGVSCSRGATNGEQSSPGSFSFSLKNLTSTYSGPTLLRRPVRFRANRGGTIYELGRFHVTDVTSLRDGFRRLRVSGTDALAAWEETKRGGDMAWHLAQAGAVARWPLSGEGPTAIDTLGSGVVLEMRDCDAEASSPTYGTVTWGSSVVPPPTGGTCVAFEPADPDSVKGFTGLVGPISDSPTLGVSFWMRASPDLVVGGSAAVSIHKRADAVFPISVTGIVTSVPQGRTFGFIRDDTGVHPATWSSAGAGLYAAVDVGSDWVHVECRQALSGTDVSVTGGVTLINGTQFDFTSSLSADDWSTSTGAGWGAVIIGGDPAGLLLAAICEVAEFAVFDKSLSTESGIVRATIGWPGESPADRAARLAADAAWPTAPTISATVPIMSSGPDSRSSLLDGMREVEGVTLGLLTPMADGSLRIFSRGELDEDAAFVSSLGADQLLRDSDGVATNTGLLVNSSTVTGAADTTAAYRDALADTYGDRADDRALATADSDWVTSAASWLARRQANPLGAFAVPTLQLDPAKLRKLQGSWDATALLPFTTDIGAVITLPDIHTDPLEVIVMGISWQVTQQGQWVCSWSARPHGRLTYAALDDTLTASLDNVTIGW